MNFLTLFSDIVIGIVSIPLAIFLFGVFFLIALVLEGTYRVWKYVQERSDD